MLIAGNWKMNGLAAQLDELGRVADGLAGGSATVLLCPPATLIAAAAKRADGSALKIGGQDCHASASGAHTGDMSAEMLADAGASHVIVGHSERRADHGESSETVRAKAEAGARAGLTPIVCVGETEAERDAGRAWNVVKAQLDGSVPPGEGAVIVAYEPVWAIGTGKTASLDDIADMHGRIHEWASGRAAQVLYGGSVKPSNAADILGVDGVDGALVGGASLKADDFLAIVREAH